MSKPRIYGTCPAGCLWETVHKADFEKSASFITITDNEGKRELILEKGKTYLVKKQRKDDYGFTILINYSKTQSFIDSDATFYVSNPENDIYSDYLKVKLLDVYENIETNRDVYLYYVLELDGVRMVVKSDRYIGNVGSSSYTTPTYNCRIRLVQTIFETPLTVLKVNEDAVVGAEKVYIRYSANADGTDFTETWSEGQNYIGVASGTLLPSSKLEFTWMRIGDFVNVVQGLGDSEINAVSQKAFTEEVKKLTSIADAYDSILEFADENGNIVLRVKNNGHIQTANFDSENIDSIELLQDEKDLSRCDFGKEMATGINYYVEGDVIVCKCNISNLSGSMLKIFTAVGSGVARGSASFIDFENGTMGMYEGIASTSSPLNIKYSKKISFTLVAGREYVVEMMRKGKEHTLKITDSYSLESDFLTVMPTSSNDIGEHWGKRSYAVSGGVNVTSFKDYCLEPYECRLLIIGDSFIEGATGFSNHANRYCARMKRILNGSCAINGFGGATTEQVSAFYEEYCKTIFNPEYVLIACGTNNYDYSTWLNAQMRLIASIKAAGSIPVLVTITRRLDNDNLSFIRQANAWIRNESGELFIDINRITTVGYDGENQNTEMFASDKVHPLPATHELIVKRALLDIPEVFNLSGSYIKNRNSVGGKNK